jgi:hypothetical protein
VDIILSHKKWGQCGVMEQCVIIQYCVVSKHWMLLSDHQYRTWHLETSVHVGFPTVYCSSTVFVPVLFICSSALTAVVWTHDMASSSLCFLKFQWCDMFWPILATTSGISYCGCVFVFCAGGVVLNSPLHCRAYSIYRWRRRKTNHNLTFHKNSVFLKNVLNPLSCTAISWNFTEVHI